MNNKIVKQIKNEWKPNLWLFMELFLVSVVMWYIVDYMFVVGKRYNEPNGFDISHCYLIETGTLTNKSADYVPSDSFPGNHLNELCDRLAHHPAIQYVGLGQNAYPYNNSNSGTNIGYDTIFTDSWVLRRMVTPDFINVFRYRGLNGESPEALASKLTRRSILATNDIFHDKLPKGVKSIVGKQIISEGDTTNTLTMAACIQPIKYQDFAESGWNPCVISYLPDEWRWVGLELCVRVRPDMDKDFAQSLLKDSKKLYNIGNLYISSVKSFDNIRSSYIAGDLSKLKMHIWGMGFLLLNIFLGLLGTFWFRTQQRRGEIALLKSFGDTDKGVYFRLIAEGLIILTLATIPAVIIDYNLANADITEAYKNTTFEIVRFTFSASASYLLIALMMVIGISIPARKAMKIQPAEALHEE